MGRYKPFMVLGTAVIIALITSVLSYSWLQKKVKSREARLETQPIAVALADLPGGIVLTKEMLTTTPFLKTSLPEGCFSDPSRLVGRVVISPIKAREPILESRLAPVSFRTGGVAAVIGLKKRAVAVRVDRTTGVSGFIHPGNRVDVLVTLTSGKNPISVTKTVLENILVLATGPEIEKKGKEERPMGMGMNTGPPGMDVDTITLEVTPEEAEKLTLAAVGGKLQLALRNASDMEAIITEGVTIPALLASYGAGSPVRENEPDPAARVAEKPSG